MPQTYRAALLLYIYDGLSVLEVADALGIREGAPADEASGEATGE